MLPRFTHQLSRDSGKYYRAQLAGVVQPEDEDQLRDALLSARRQGLKVAVKGGGWSQGGLIQAERCVQIDTARLNRILDVDPVEQTARVECGVTWDQLRAALHPLGLATRSSQSYGVFSVGGAVSVNAHGRNVDSGVLGASVLAMRVMRSDGTVVETSRTQHPELFSAVLGGLGLVAFILDVTLRLTVNDFYVKSGVSVMPIEHYPHHFLTRVRTDPEIHFHYARLSVAEGEVWDRLLCVDYRVEADAGEAHPGDELREDGGVALQRFSLWCMRHFRTARKLRMGWELLHRIAPERARRNTVARESMKAIERNSRRSADWLQEFFIPVDQLTRFVDAARQVLRTERFPLLNTTLRFLPRNTDAMLSCARSDCFSLVIFFEQPLGEAAIANTRRVLRKLLDCALACNGAYYLCYHRFATPEQLERAYPRIGEFFAVKRKHDPHALFDNQFYEHYATASEPAPPSSQSVRPLRLPAPQRFTPVTRDGVKLVLERYEGGKNGTVILAAGYAMASKVFTLDTIPTNLAEYLCERGFDTWIMNWRSCPGVAASRDRFTLDDVARHDWPTAIEFVRRQTGAAQVDCVAHCIASQTLLMSLALGELDGQVRSAVCLQAGLHYDMPWLTRFKSLLRLPQILDAMGVRYLSASADPHDGPLYQALDTALEHYPISARERCDNPTCRRSGFLWGELNNHANLSDATHRRMGELLGDASIYPFIQMTGSTRRRHVVDAAGGATYLAAVERLRLPITFLHGSDNGVFRASSTLRTYELLRERHGPDLYRRHAIDGYGHMDCLIGDDSADDVFPHIEEHLERVGRGEAREGYRDRSGEVLRAWA